MSQNSPTSIPAAYQTELLEDAYRRGWNHGHGIACHNVPDLGADLWVDDLGKVTVDAENIREVHQSLCYSAESNSRSYSPFEFTAHEFNAAGEPWDDCEILPDANGSFAVVDRSGEELESGFETAELAQAWIDAQPSADELWDAFESGTNDAIDTDLSEYSDSDYGIESESIDSE
jgi:hypothetical protein